MEERKRQVKKAALHGSKGCTTSENAFCKTSNGPVPCQKPLRTESSHPVQGGSWVFPLIEQFNSFLPKQTSKKNELVFYRVSEKNTLFFFEAALQAVAVMKSLSSKRNPRCTTLKEEKQTTNGWISEQLLNTAECQIRGQKEPSEQQPCNGIEWD